VPSIWCWIWSVPFTEEGSRMVTVYVWPQLMVAGL
jgi:hypothetical protein